MKTSFDKILAYLQISDLKDYLVERNINLIFAALAVIIGVYLNWQIQEIATFVLVIWQILNPFPSHVMAKSTAALLIFVPIFLVIHREDMAETFSIYAYYFLVLTVLTAIFEYRKEKREAK